MKLPTSTSTHRPRSEAPGAQGLYDPRHEHDACGVGFVVDIKGRKSNKIVRDAIQVLKNLDHRGACGCEVNTGDGAGVLMQTPHAFLAKVAKKAGITLPGPGQYACGLIYLPRNATQRRKLEEVFARTVQAEGQELLGWRTVPTDNKMLGDTARACEPFMRQVFIGRGADTRTEADFERKLYVIRKRAYNDIRTTTRDGSEYWYVASLSYKTLVYKGMLLTTQLDAYFADLRDPSIESALALVHSRFSTNTFPSWERAHPYRYLAHNGEINTLRGNINWMRAREAMFESELFGEDIDKIRPIVNPFGSDSSMFDNVLELMVLAGRSLPHALMMMIPEPWAKHESMDDSRRAFYQYHSSLMEPWDGPADISFTDGVQIGALLDRNGLRPGRYYVTDDDVVVMASEAGVLDFPPEKIVRKGRLQPGVMFLVDTAEGRIIDDAEIKAKICGERPYRQWLNDNLVYLEDLPAAGEIPLTDHDTLLARQVSFGYSFEDQRILMAPMARDGVEAVGSMGNDTPLAALSNRPRMLYDYFKQLFAQVTNPPIDSIREEIITSSEVWLGSEGNLLNPQPTDCRRVELKGPVLTNEEFARIRRLSLPGIKVETLPILFRVARGEKGLTKSIEEMCVMARRAIEESEVNVLILSDRGVNRDFAPIPSLLAVSALHHYLIREGLRLRVSLAIETGDAREVHHFALLIGYGCAIINPYMAFETIDGMIRHQLLPNVDHTVACRNFSKSAVKGVVKVMSKMGISAVQSYHGAQVFEAVGLRQDVIDHYFTGTASRVGGIGIEVIAREALMRHAQAFPVRGATERAVLDAGGLYQWRADGEFHLFNPESIHRLQKSVRTGSYSIFKSYASLIDDQAKNHATLRGLLDFKKSESVPIDEVESVESIMKRFKTGAMSYGSISKEAHETLAIAMNRIGGKSNTGDQAGRVRPLRRDLRVSGQRAGNPDQDGAGREAGRGRAAARHQGLSVDCEDAAHHRGRRPHLAAAAPRHLFDRGSRAADLRLEEREPARTHPREAGGRGGRRHGCRRRLEGARRRGTHQRTRWRHRCVATHQHQAQRRTVGTGPCRNPAGPRPQQPAQPHHGRDRRPVEDRARRRDRRVVRRRGIRLCDRAAGGDRLHHDAGLPPQHLPGGCRDPGPAAARALPGPARARGQFHALRRAAPSRDHGGTRLPHHQRDGRPRRPARGAQGHRSLEGEGLRLQQHPLPAGRAGRRRPLQADRAGPRHREIARHDAAAGYLQTSDRARRESERGTAGAQRQPRGRHHHGQRNHPQVGRQGTAERHHSNQVHGLGGSEFCRVHAEWHEFHAGRRRQRLFLQGSLGRTRRSLSVEAGQVRSGRQHHHRQRRALWRHGRRGLRPWHGGRTLWRA
jgi:glutamate synthase domain-containing protein 1